MTWVNTKNYQEGNRSIEMFPLRSISIFDGENHHVWAIKILAYLEGVDFWDTIEGDYEEVQ